MYDSVTLDQLRALVAVTEEGSFSAAARKLRRVQSAVSTSMANLEAHLGVGVWDRSTKVATLTDAGRVVLASARRILAEVDGLRSLTANLAAGVEPSVSLCLDVFFPLDALLDLCADFAARFPTVDLRVESQVMSAVSVRVREGVASLGVVSPLGERPGLERRVLGAVRLIPVAGRDHPLASIRGPVPTRALATAVQIVLSERSDVGVDDQGVLSPRTWRVADLSTKHAMLLRGLGWGNLPEHLVRNDIRAGRLTALRLESLGDAPQTLTLAAVWRPDAPLGPAHKWVLGELERRFRGSKRKRTAKRTAKRSKRA